MAGSHVGSFKD